MLSRLGEGARWRDAAQRLGLVAYRSNASVEECADWDAVRRVVLRPMSSTYATGDLMVGTRRGRNVMVALTDVFSRPFIDAQTGHTRRRVLHQRTHFIAAIEPPLRIGLSIGPEAFASARQPDVLTGDARLDAAYRIWSADPESARAFVRRLRGDGNDVADVLLRAIDGKLFAEINDTFVRLWYDGIAVDPSFLGYWLDQAAWLAEASIRARAAMPPSSLETACRDALERSAAELRLTVDRDALTSSGLVGHVGVGIHLGSVRGGLFTTITASIPSPVAYGLRIERREQPGPTLGDWILAVGQQDVKTGIPAFDGVFRVAGYPPDVVAYAVRATAPKLLDVLARTRAVQVVANTVRVELRGVEVDPASLVRAVSDTVEIARALSSPMPASEQSPYR